MACDSRLVGVTDTLAKLRKRTERSGVAPTRVDEQLPGEQQEVSARGTPRTINTDSSAPPAAGNVTAATSAAGNHTAVATTSALCDTSREVHGSARAVDTQTATQASTSATTTATASVEKATAAIPPLELNSNAELSEEPDEEAPDLLTRLKMQEKCA